MEITGDYWSKLKKTSLPKENPGDYRREKTSLHHQTCYALELLKCIVLFQFPWLPRSGKEGQLET